MWVLVALLPLVAARSAHPHRPQRAFEDNSYPYQPVVPYYEAPVQECPQMAPTEIDLDELLGSWHLSLLLLADRVTTADGLLDESMCAEVDLVRTNGSMLRLDWQLRQLNLPAGLADLRLQVAAAILGQPGLWALATPLGGEMVGTVSHAVPDSHMVLTVCGEGAAVRGAARAAGRGGAVHALTALLTRRPPSAVGSLELLRLSAHMVPSTGNGGGFRHADERLLSWGQC
ncbi:uncharacterized protein LOC117643859 [Thrips palmi]|uniref:Uncharacterized protein LOC117643859 n=1 Tax=Thrips palmi TaxID=161013 RepID=A0A6P8YNT5_THRPL|nr:uncharacterized protein LOC117643859 [Thrips palmi]